MDFMKWNSQGWKHPNSINTESIIWKSKYLIPELPLVQLAHRVGSVQYQSKNFLLWSLRILVNKKAVLMTVPKPDLIAPGTVDPDMFQVIIFHHNRRR